MSATRQLIEDIRKGFENLDKGQLNPEDLADLKAKTLQLYDKLSIINYKIIEAQVKEMDTSNEKIIKEVERKERIHQDQKNQTNLISAIQEQEVISEGYNVSDKGLSFEDLLFENEESSESNNTVELFETEAEDTPVVQNSNNTEPVIELDKTIVNTDDNTPEVTINAVEEETIFEEPAVETPKVEKVEEVPVKNETAAFPTKESQDNSLNDQFAEKNNTPSVADKLAEDTKEAQTKEIASKMQKDPISDLKKAISINQKFIFINDLFNGEVGVYNDMIDQINNAGDMSAAEGLLKAISQEYQWDTDSASVMNFIELVQRRF